MIYTQLTAAQAQQMLDRFGGGKVTGVTPLRGGSANSNFRVDCSDRESLVLKICDNLPPERASLMASHSLHLAMGGVATPAPVVGSDGELTWVRAGVPWMLQPFVEGHWLEPNPQSLFNLGIAIAKIHRVPPPQDLPQGFQMGLCLMDEVLVRAGQQDSAHPFVPRLASEIRRLQSELPTDLPRGVVHGDIFPDNVIAHGNDIRAILDFEEVALESLVLDIAMAFIGCGWEDEEPVRERWDALLAGYESVRALSSNERAALPLYCHYAAMGIATWRFGQFVLSQPQLGEQSRFEQMLSRIERFEKGLIP
jgi:homoserine kinase type II